MKLRNEVEQRRAYLIQELRKLGHFPNAERWALADLEWVYVKELNKAAKAYGGEER